MIECDSLSLPPQGCLQYHTGVTGTVCSISYFLTSKIRVQVESFNWDDSTAYEHLNNQHYRVSKIFIGNLIQRVNFQACIRQERGYCNIGWRQSDTSIDTFKVNS